MELSVEIPDDRVFRLHLIVKEMHLVIKYFLLTTSAWPFEAAFSIASLAKPSMRWMRRPLPRRQERSNVHHVSCASFRVLLMEKADDI
jgi:hypothetical protein